MNNVWIVVCDAARARIFETRTGEPTWKLLEVLAHDASRTKGSDLATDGAGSRSSQGRSAHHNALAPSTAPHEVEKGHFAHELGKVLDQGMRSQKFFRCLLVAPPHFAGLLKKELTPEVHKHVLAIVDKDLTHFSVNELMERLGDQARIPLNERQELLSGAHATPH